MQIRVDACDTHSITYPLHIKMFLVPNRNLFHNFIQSFVNKPYHGNYFTNELEMKNVYYQASRRLKICIQSFVDEVSIFWNAQWKLAQQPLYL